MRNLFPVGVLIAAITTLGDVILVENGNPKADIVASESAHPSVQAAAKELRRHLKEISGAELAIVNAPSKDVDNHVYVGESEYTKKLGVTLDDVKHDGFKIIAKDDYVVVAGKEFDNHSTLVGTIKDTSRDRQKKWEEFTGKPWRRPCFHNYANFNKELGFDLLDGTGTLYGVYALLEQLGWLWVMPDPEIGIVYPDLKTVVIKDQSIKREPEFPIREFRDGGKGQFTEEMLWHKSMGIGDAFVLPAYHSIGRLTHWNEEKQPEEYFGKVGGEIRHTSPKLSSERLRLDFIEYLERFEEAFPGIDYTSIGQPDGWTGIDEADAAAGWDKLNQRGSKGRYSDYYWDFIMDVRERFMKKHPDKRFTVYAYGPTGRVPANLDRVPENVVVDFTQACANWNGGDQTLKRRREWLDKMSQAGQLYIHEYHIKHSYTYKFPPVPIIFTADMKRNFAELYDKSVGGLVETGWTSTPQRKKTPLVTPRVGISHLMLLLYSRLWWDRDLDVDAFIDDYCGKFFGPAKDDMKEFYRFTEEVWTRPEPREITQNGGFLKKEDVKKYFEILERAKEKAGDTIYGKRIDFIAKEMESLKTLHDKLKRLGPKIKCLPGKGEFVLDGDIDTPFWREVPGHFFPMKDMVTGERPRHVSTSASFRWLPGASALAVAIECLEPNMDQLRVHCRDRDSSEIFSDDNVEIVLETNNGVCPKIVVNPDGVVWDRCVTTNVADLPQDYTVRDVAVKKHPDRWTVEMKIPAKPISGDRPSPHYPWGIHVNRQRLAGNEPEHYMLCPSGTNFKDKLHMGNLYMR